MEWGPYDLDWFQFVLGDLFQPVSVFARTDSSGYEEGDLECSFSAEILLASGISLTWERRAEHGPQWSRVEIRGTNGGCDLPFCPEAKPRALTLHHYEANELISEIRSEPAVDWESLLQHPLHDFARSITTGQEAASPVSLQVKIHAVIDALYESAANGRAVEI